MKEPYSQEDFNEVAKLKCECVVCPDCRGTGEIRRALDGFRESERCDSCSAGIIDLCSRCQLLEEMEQDNEEYHYLRERFGTAQ